MKQTRLNSVEKIHWGSIFSLGQLCHNKWQQFYTHLCWLKGHYYRSRTWQCFQSTSTFCPLGDRYPMMHWKCIRWCTETRASAPPPKKKDKPGRSPSRRRNRDAVQWSVWNWLNYPTLVSLTQLLHVQFAWAWKKDSENENIHDFTPNFSICIRSYFIASWHNTHAIM